VPLVVVLPAGSPPPGGWPVAIVGHGYGGEMFGAAVRLAGTLARRGLATVAVTVVGHGGGPHGRLIATRADGRTVVVHVPGRGLDQDGDGVIGSAEGAGTATAGPVASIGLRDTLRQQAVDVMALVRALRGGLDADGDGRPDTSGTALYYVGQSLGAIYGTLVLAVDPRLPIGVLNVPGAPIVEVARLSPVFRPRLAAALGARTPSLLNRGDDFREDLPGHGRRVVVGPAAGALEIQETLARLAWLGRRGDPLAYARHLRTAPLPGREPKPVLVQFARDDGVVPNPTTSALVRAGQLHAWTTLVRYDRVEGGLPREVAEPHGFLLRVRAPGAAGAVARRAQEQVARFFLSGGAVIWDPDDAGPVFEVPAGELPEGPPPPRPD
jgi:dienelactone hydrolase